MPNREILIDETQIKNACQRIGQEINFSAAIDTGTIPRRIFKSYLAEGITVEQTPREVVCPENIKFLKNSEYINNFFANRGFEIIKPLYIINKNQYKTTDFIGAGIFMIENEIHSPGARNKSLKFVSQPSFRTQHIGSTTIGFSPAFVNLASIGIGLDFDQHCTVIKHWEDFLVSLGMSRSNINYQENWVKKQWGKTGMTGHEVYFYYQGFPLGDASFNTVTDGANAGFSFSDTGFGLERIKWLLQGGEYQQTFSGSNSLYKDISYPDICRLHALTLLIGEDVRPGANGNRAKVRKLSKEYVGNNPGQDTTGNIISDFYNNWSMWTNLLVNKPEVVGIILQENQNNVEKK